ncbi:alpha/beta fold hydrolase [Actinomadura scrupuli]|uniref:alpha/beta fold hydrolase n=1 Tax=Actinomadura scrupuli TaxID=559629 RepID=UPI003D98C5FE
MARLPAGPVEFRFEARGDAAVIVFHGGHMRAGLALGEDVFAALGYTLLVPSRPGYGRTPLRTGTSPTGFADVTARLCEHLGIDRVAAVVGISGGGPTAVTMAARHPELVGRLILESAVSFLPWPDRRTRLGAHVVFSAVTEKLTWGLVHTLMGLAPATGLRFMLRELSTEPARDVLAALSDADRATLVTLFSHMRSGRGFLNDLKSTPDVTSQVTQPTLVIAGRRDAAVPFAHAQSLAGGIPHAELLAAESAGHLIWCADDYTVIADRIRRFLGPGTLPPAEPC